MDVEVERRRALAQLQDALSGGHIDAHQHDARVREVLHAQLDAAVLGEQVPRPDLWPRMPGSSPATPSPPPATPSPPPTPVASPPGPGEIEQIRAVDETRPFWASPAPVLVAALVASLLLEVHPVVAIGLGLAWLYWVYPSFMEEGVLLAHRRRAGNHDEIRDGRPDGG